MTKSDEPAAETLIRDLHALWNAGDLGGIHRVYSEGFVAHMPKGWERSEFKGHAGVRDAILRIRNAFPDWHEDIKDMVIDKQKVVTRYVSTGTHTGPFLGLEPTGRPVMIDEISIYHLERGLVMEQWCLTDDLSLARQLGLIEQ
ncbi:MAG: ester cyclase [Pseudomonadota bacterium]